MVVKILITGGAGFIGSALVRHLHETGAYTVLNLDALTYAGNLENIPSGIENSNRYSFVRGSINDGDLVSKLLIEHNIAAVMHLAAESHVDRSIDSPQEFINTNVVGTFVMLDCSRKYIMNSTKDIKFLHISTDEVFGSLGEDKNTKFTEVTPYDPRSPYSASKASSDHLVRAWYETYGLPIVLTNCSNKSWSFNVCLLFE